VWSAIPSFSLPLLKKTARMLADHLFICSRRREDLAQVATARGAQEGSTLSLSSINVESQCSVDPMYKVASSDVCVLRVVLNDVYLDVYFTSALAVLWVSRDDKISHLRHLVPSGRSVLTRFLHLQRIATAHSLVPLSLPSLCDSAPDNSCRGTSPPKSSAGGGVGSSARCAPESSSTFSLTPTCPYFTGAPFPDSTYPLV
jgi:hypothetical protein